MTSETCPGSGSVAWRLAELLVQQRECRAYRCRSTSGTVAMKYRGFSQKSVRSVTRDTTPAALTISEWARLQCCRITSRLVLTTLQL
jgi:hypothetical protein